jgi:hypothetical protein
VPRAPVRRRDIPVTGLIGAPSSMFSSCQRRLPYQKWCARSLYEYALTAHRVCARTSRPPAGLALRSENHFCFHPNTCV